MMRRALLAGLAGLALAAPLAAQTRCEPAVTGHQRWAPPLDRAITINDARLSLRAALERVAAAGNVRLSYSPQLLPLNASVCIGYDAIALGDALQNLLRGVAVEPVPGGSDQIVLAPVRHEPSAPGLPAVEPVYTLPPVIATANANAPAQSTAATATAAVSGNDISNRSNGAFADALNGAIPGLWVWNTSPASLLTQYGSLRGASSFGLSAPKVYIDGIEVANPLLLTRITPDAIERIEVIRGPQGAALYGADAISGVTNIITRHERVGDGIPRVRVRSSFGVSGTDYAPAATFGQEHTLSFRAGAGDHTAGIDLQFGSAGEFVPGAFSQHLSADGSLQRVGARTVVSGTARLSSQNSGAAQSPLVADAVGEFPSLAASRRSLRQYTLGARASYQRSQRWQHSIVAGIDGYSLGGVSDAGSFLLSPSDLALRAAGANALRTTLRLSSNAELVSTPILAASLAVAAEHSFLRQQGEPAAVGTAPVWAGANTQTGYGLRPPTTLPGYGWQQMPAVEESRVNTGVSAQLNTSLANRLHINGGVRLDRQSSTVLATGTALLPTLGVAYVIGGPVSLKLRGAYGKGIRWPQLTGGPESWQSRQGQSTGMTLEPEQQDGIEAGFDFAVGRSLSLQVTRFDQTASGLIQRVGTATSDGGIAVNQAYRMQNVGEVGNNGWEVQASWQQGAFALAGTLSLVDSRVTQLAAGYAGDLQAGDRMLAVPAQTIGVMAVWTGSRWSTTVTAARASDWINYDRVALARSLAASAEAGGTLPGSQLREFWRAYDGFTRLHAVISHEIRPGFLLTLTGDNLLGYQIGEPDNITITPGRTLSIGLRTSF